MKKETLKKLIEDSFQKSDNIFQFKREVIALVNEYCEPKTITINSSSSESGKTSTTVIDCGKIAIDAMTRILSEMEFKPIEKEVVFPLPNTSVNNLLACK